MINNQIADNLKTVHEQIAQACDAAGRRAESVNLVAVTKKQPPEKIQTALDAGQRLFGENRVQEAKGHWAELKRKYPDIKLHLVGPLQTNKVREAVGMFDCIETVDRPNLVDALADEMKKQDRVVSCLIQVNTGEEEQKSGVLPLDFPGLLEYCRSRNLPVAGLMCIPPLEEPPALHFAFLKKLADEHSLPELSMGMSADFEKAIPLGATYIRVGTAIFGERNTGN